MSLIDLHCDTLMKAWHDGKTDLNSLPYSIDLDKLEKGKVSAQFFAMFLLPEDFLAALPEKKQVTDDIYILALRKILLQTIEKYPNRLAMALSATDLEINKEKGRVSAFLTIEDGRSVEGRLEKLKYYYELGVRLISLTWNYENCFGFPNSPDSVEMAKGLKPFGKEAIPYMEELGMLVDVSHLSDGGFFDVAQIASKPFIASHSNCRALSPHPRNLTDDMIRVLAQAGGVAGLNFAPAFLHPDIRSKESRLEDMSRHVQHLLQIGGEEVLALGTDFDGISGNLEVADASHLSCLIDRLKKDGLTERQLDKFCFENALRVIKETIK